MNMRLRKFLVLLIAGWTFCSGSRVSAELGLVIPMGDLERWSIFALGGDTSRIAVDTVVDGDFGAAGSGQRTLAGDLILDGNVYYRSNAVLKVGSDVTITGSRINDQNSMLDNAVNEATAASNAAAAFAATRPLDQVNVETGANLGFTGAPGETVVLNLKSFQMNGNSTFTLNGSADTTYIINVRKSFSLTGNAKIVLTGGLDWNDVLFNVRGKGAEVRLSQNASFQGVLMANKRMVRLRDSAIFRGEIIANSVQLQGSSQVIHPPATSP